MWNAVNFRPQNILHDVGLKILFVSFELDYVARTMGAKVYDNHFLEMYANAPLEVLAEIVKRRASCLAPGDTDPFLAGRFDLITVAGEENTIFSMWYIPPEGDEIVGIGLATRASPGSHTADDVENRVE